MFKIAKIIAKIVADVVDVGCSKNEASEMLVNLSAVKKIWKQCSKAFKRGKRML